MLGVERKQRQTVQMKTFMALLLSFLCTVAVAEDIKHTDEPLADVKKAVESGTAVLVDVRNKEEWEDGHLKSAVFLPLGELRKAEKAPGNLPKDKPIYVHCAAGLRALAGAKKLKELGYDARALKPGFDELKKNGFEPAPKETK